MNQTQTKAHKAWSAAVAAGAAAAASSWATGGAPHTAGGWAALIGGTLTAAAVAWVGVYWTNNPEKSA